MNHRAWILTLDILELMLRGKIAVLRNRYIKAVAKGYEKNQAIPSSERMKHEAAVNNAIATQYKKVIPIFRNKIRHDMKHCGYAVEKKAISNYDAIIAEWISTEALRKAKMIAATDSQDILDAIEAGMLEGSTLPEISKAIRGKAGLTPMRASVIARTETHNASTYASVESVREVEVETGVKFMKQWIATNDTRTRDRHSEMIGSEPIPMDEKFYVGGEYLDRAGDPSGSPENVINCRCQMIFSEQ